VVSSVVLPELSSGTTLATVTQSKVLPSVPLLVLRVEHTPVVCVLVAAAVKCRTVGNTTIVIPVAITLEILGVEHFTMKMVSCSAISR
jgi:hypothetical protein